MMKRIAYPTFALFLAATANALDHTDYDPLSPPAGWDQANTNSMVDACLDDHDNASQIEYYCKENNCSSALRRQMFQVCENIAAAKPIPSSGRPPVHTDYEPLPPPAGWNQQQTNAMVDACLDDEDNAAQIDAYCKKVNCSTAVRNQMLRVCQDIAAAKPISPGTDPIVTPPAPAAPAALPAPGRFAAFESGQVRPLALSADGSRLYAVNTPDNRLEIFDTSGNSPQLLESVKVGLEPVAVALHPHTGQVWVVNHLSDSVSIIDTSRSPARLVRTLYVGDEPRDIVFAGDRDGRAFITAAHRGQNTGFDPQLLTPSVGRADVWVFDVNNLGRALGGEPLTIINMFGDTLRALARSPDGTQVFAAVFNSGNRTTVLSADLEGESLRKPPPVLSEDDHLQPGTGLIVRYDGNWRDNGDPVSGVAGRQWDDRVNFSLPDNDLFVIDADAAMPALVATAQGVGTTLFNIAVNPVTESLYVSNTEARNHVRFEGPGLNSTTVRGHFVESRISVVRTDGVAPRHLNKHITSYDEPLGTAAERRRSLAMPLEMVLSDDARTLYIAAFSSGKVGILDTTELEADTFVPSESDHVEVGGGPSGLALDESRGRLFVMTRFDNSIKVIDTETRQVVNSTALFNPEPSHIVEGRPFLYDARLTSSRGDSSCGGCHVFGDMDHLAWDLGNPDEMVAASPNRYNDKAAPEGRIPFFHPMKGPMTTQSFRGMRGQGPMHWRGDRTGTSRDADETIEEQAFEDFNVAFTGLVGRAMPLTEQQMDKFAHFALALEYPPNPIRALDNSLTPTQAAGHDFFMNQPVVTDGNSISVTCNDCHRNNPAKGQFGTDGTQSVEGGEIAENFKIPHLRNMYQKVGRFGSTDKEGPFMGPQIRGYGYAHDGVLSTVEDFLLANVFHFPNALTRRQVVEFTMAFPAEHAPVVGQQVTLSDRSPAVGPVQQRIGLLQQRAEKAECELVVSGVINGKVFDAVRNVAGSFSPASTESRVWGMSDLLTAAVQPDNALTFSCVPLGSGRRIGVDRDLDGVLDGDE